MSVHRPAKLNLPVSTAPVKATLTKNWSPALILLPGAAVNTTLSLPKNWVAQISPVVTSWNVVLAWSIPPDTPSRKMKAKRLAQSPAPLDRWPGLKVMTPRPRPGSPKPGWGVLEATQVWPSGSVSTAPPPNGTTTAWAAEAATRVAAKAASGANFMGDPCY